MKKFKRIMCFLCVFFIMFLIHNVVYAESYNVDVSTREMTTDQIVTVNLSITAGVWNISVNGGGLTLVNNENLNFNRSITSS